MPHFFEFGDQPWVPEPIRTVMVEAIEAVNWNFPRRYYAAVARETRRFCEQEGIRAVYEVGAGTAPISRWMASEASDLRFHPSDIKPDVTGFREIELFSKGRIK